MSSDPEQTIARLAIFASGGGSNARKIIDYFEGHPRVQVALIVTNKPSAGVLHHAAECHVPAMVMSRSNINSADTLLPVLQAYRVDYIALAGFLLLVPSYLVNAFERRIVNIHPALLPDFGGKGMYGMHVHRAVKKSGVSHSGVTIHFVNENYDEGAVIFQDRVQLTAEDSPEDIAAKVLELEHRSYPKVLEDLIMSRQKAGLQNDS